ncbi:hypothetical protein VPH35_043610 [Triticum aestivum]
MSIDEKNAGFLSAFTDGSIDAKHTEGNLSSSKKISEGRSCEDDADSTMRPVHSKFLQQTHVEPIELDEGDAASDVEAERVHRLHEEPIAYLQLRRISTDGRSMKRRRIDN